jgi:hypothetical protein
LRSITLKSSRLNLLILQGSSDIPIVGFVCLELLLNDSLMFRHKTSITPSSSEWMTNTRPPDWWTRLLETDENYKTDCLATFLLNYMFCKYNKDSNGEVVGPWIVYAYAITQYILHGEMLRRLARVLYSSQSQAFLANENLKLVYRLIQNEVQHFYSSSRGPSPRAWKIMTK